MRMKLISYCSGYSAVILVHVKCGTCLEVGSPVVDSWDCMTASPASKDSTLYITAGSSFGLFPCQEERNEVSLGIPKTPLQ